MAEQNHARDRARKYQSKLIDAEPADLGDGRPIITDGDSLLAALWKYHADTMPEGNLPPLDFVKYAITRLNGEKL
jgi:hypothetical protein